MDVSFKEKGTSIGEDSHDYLKVDFIISESSLMNCSWHLECTGFVLLAEIR